MTPGNSSAIDAVSAVASSGSSGATVGLPSQASFDVAAQLAQAFNRPDSSIADLAQAVDGFVNAKSTTEAVDAFKKIATLLGVDTNKSEASQGSEASGAAAPASSAQETGGDDLDSLIEKLIKMLKAMGMSDAAIKDLLGPVLQALGKSPDEVSAMLDKSLGSTGGAGTAGSTSAEAGTSSAVQLNRV